MELLPIKSWLIFLNLQVGVMFCATSFIILALCIMVINVEPDSLDSRYALNVPAYTFAFIIIFIWIIAFFGAYLQNLYLVFIALCFWTIFIVCWIFMATLALLSTKFGNLLCMNQKCPSSLWLCPNVHYGVFHNKIDYFYHVPHDPPPDFPIRDPFKNYDVAVPAYTDSVYGENNAENGYIDQDLDGTSLDDPDDDSTPNADGDQKSTPRTLKLTALHDTIESRLIIGSLMFVIFTVTVFSTYIKYYNRFEWLIESKSQEK